MIKKAPIVAVFAMMLAGYVFFAAGLRQERQTFIADQFVEYSIPSELLAPLSLEFKGLTSDFLLFKFMTFIGGRTQQLYQFDDKAWTSIEHTLDTITDLDPYYWDAYLFSQVFLTFDEKHYEAANRLLSKGRKYLPDNFHIPYYMGLNHYNFGKDPGKGAQYLIEASRIPGSPFYLASLAARLSAYSSDYQRGIIFLKEMLAQTTSPEIADHYKLRIQVLERMHLLEQLVTVYQTKHNRKPSTLEELVGAGLIEKLPTDPYGGKFFIQDDGKINTTSKMVKR